jgi:CBS domain-containing protein
MPGPVTFVAEARAMSFGTRDLASASDGELLRLGTVVCDGLGIKGLGVGRVVQRLVQSEARPTTAEARAFVRSAVRGRDPASTPVREVYSAELTTLTPEDAVDDAVRLMRQKVVRRLPVVEGGRPPAGIVSLGDLAVERQPQSALGDISAAPPNP